MALSTAAIVARLALGDTTSLIFVTFYPAIMASGWWGGRGPAILSVALCALTASYLWVPFPNSMSVASIRDVVNLLLFMLVGAPIGLVSASLRATQARLRSVLDATSDGFAILDHQWRVRYVNPSLAALFQCEPRTLIGQSFWNWFPEGENGQFRKAAQLAMDGVSGHCTHYERNLGCWLDVSMYSTREGIAVVARDVTATKELDIRRAQSLSELESASRLKDDFLATVSHELRTPLNAVMGWARLLDLDHEGQRDRAVLAIQRNAATLAQLVNDLLDTSAIVNGKLQMTMAPTDLAAVVREAVDTIRLGAERKRLTVTVVGATDPLVVMGDGVRLQQVVLNLLSNAIKFTPEDGHIEVDLADHGTLATVRVTDSGIGIPAAVLPRVFDRFVQADERSSVGVGLGLGLAIVKHIVEAHGGRVDAISAGSMKGASFTLALPLPVDQDRPGRSKCLPQEASTEPHQERHDPGQS